MEDSNKVTLITGASSGIGFELANIAASYGRDLVIVSTKQKEIDAAKKQIEDKHGVKVWAYEFDLSSMDNVEQLIKTVAKQKLDVEMLFNNAGFGDFGEFKDTDWGKTRSMMTLNMGCVTRLCHEYIPGMVKANRGRVLNVASIAAFFPGPYMATYYATKSYVLSLSQALSEELEGTNVTVTALCPGPTSTGFEKTANAGNSQLFKGKLPTAKDVAEYGYSQMVKEKRIAAHGLRSKLSIFAIRFLPRSFVTSIVKKASAPK